MLVNPEAGLIRSFVLAKASFYRTSLRLTEPATTARQAGESLIQANSKNTEKT